MCDLSQFIQASTAARHLGKSTSTVRLYADAGRLPVIRTLDGVRLFRLADVLNLKAEIQKDPAPIEAGVSA